MPGDEQDKAHRDVRQDTGPRNQDTLPTGRGQIGLGTIDEGDGIETDQVHPAPPKPDVEPGRGEHMTHLVDDFQERRDDPEGQKRVQREHVVALGDQRLVVAQP